MKAVEFEGSVTPDGKIALPPEVAAEIPMGEQLRVVVMWEPSNSVSAWHAEARKNFEAAYCPEDSVYEQLIDDPAAW
jgi:hypothetical protein